MNPINLASVAAFLAANPKADITSVTFGVADMVDVSDDICYSENLEVPILEMPVKSFARVTTSAHPDVPNGSLVIRANDEFLFVTGDTQYYSTAGRVRDYGVTILDECETAKKRECVYGVTRRHSGSGPIKNMGTKSWAVVAASPHENVPVGSIVVRIQNEFLFITADGGIFWNSFGKVKDYAVTEIATPVKLS